MLSAPPETFGPHNNVESFTAALVSMSKSMSAPHVSGLTAMPSSLMLRCATVWPSPESAYQVNKTSQSINVNQSIETGKSQLEPSSVPFFNRAKSSMGQRSTQLIEITVHGTVFHQEKCIPLIHFF